MYLKKLTLLNFKNHAEKTWEFCHQINCISGENGVGKTNVLDAIHYLSTCKSYFNQVDSQNIFYEKPYMSIKGVFEKEQNMEVQCYLKRGQKKVVKKNESEYERLSDHIGEIPLIIITPVDIYLINEGSEERRKFINLVISQFSRDYLEAVMRYNKILTQRNEQLKLFAEVGYFDKSLLEAMDAQMIPLGEQIHQARKSFFEEFSPLFQQYYSQLTGGKEEVAMTYDSQLNNSDFTTLLVENIEKDRGLQRSTQGIHKDDFVFEMGGHSVKKYASQGQIKSYLIAMKLAKFNYLKNKTGKIPMLLLDDIFEKIDENRAKNLMALLTEDDFGQIFITDTHAERLKEVLSGLAAEKKFINIEKENLETLSL